MSQKLDMNHAVQMDLEDPLHSLRNEFYIPGGCIYMDGNSLGLASKSAEKAVLQALDDWKQRGIGGWLNAQPAWFDIGELLGARLAALVGARPKEVVVTGSTTVNLHQLVASFYRPSGSRTILVGDELNFPSDIYALRSQVRLRGLNPDRHLHLVRSENGRTLSEAAIEEALSTRVALVVLPSVLYRSGQLLDMQRLTDRAHEVGALIGFDCSHSVGVIPHEFDTWEVDFAFWCNYKYMNGGPGATAALFVNERLHHTLPGLTGWWGNDKASQFEMRLDYEPGAGAGAFQLGTPPVLSTLGLLGAIDVLERAGLDRVRCKSLALTEYLIELIDRYLEPLGFSVGTPRARERRGGHVALEHPEIAVQVNSALKARGVIPDYRPPNIIRLAPVPLYNTFLETWQVVQTIKELVESREYERFDNQREPVS